MDNVAAENPRLCRSFRRENASDLGAHGQLT